ncbi:MAG: exodeoxyribonuclease V subunit gamma [Clostridiales Family XIII bacterium]|nr:exodeoxyribonuclease V subunit gamma [Clostridiales Family XIII bacterium]
MFERIAEAMRSRRVFLIVPEQSTLRAEADAFAYMDAPGFIDFDVLSMTSLGRRVLEDTGYGGAPESGDGAGQLSFISKYGKFMLLSRLLYRRAGDMGVFKRLESSPDFIEKLNNMLAELKNHNVTAEGLREIASAMSTDTILRRKIEDAALIYEGYEEAISGRYMDQTDHLKLYTSKIAEASFIPDAEFWFSGFDYLSPAVMGAVIEIARRSASAGVVLTSDAGAGRADPLFALTNCLAAELARRAAEAGVEARIEPIPSGEGSPYLRDIPPEIAHIEKSLFTRPHMPFIRSDAGNDSSNNTRKASGSEGVMDTHGGAPDVTNTAPKQRPPALRLIAAANYYTEAETAAADICGLIRDGLPAPGGGREEIRYRDILVLCNDMAERGPIIRRVFHRYGLPVFMDRRRSVEHNPVIEYLLALPRIAASGRRYEDVFTLLKTGLTGRGADEIEELENYAAKYNIRGKMWDRDFTFGLKREDAHGYSKGEYEQEELDALNATRREVASLIGEFEEGFKGGRSAKVRTDALLAFLIGRARLPEMIEGYVADLEGAGMLEYAAEMSGMWGVAEEILGQMSTVLGDLTMSMDEYATVLRVGLDSVRVGVLPTVIDQIVLGTMQRTRNGDAKAVFVLGANDGVLPASVSDAAVFSEDEVYRLADAGCAVARTEETMHMEEELAIYRNLSKPSALLRVSYAASDSTGRSISPSPVFERLRRLFPDTPIERDIENAGAVGPKHPEDPLVNIQHPDHALDPLAAKLRAYMNGGPLPEAWQNVLAWYTANRPGDIERIVAGLTFRGRHERVSAEFVDGLYRRVTSPSALERYSRCPFSWFMSYGLGLKENRAAGTDDRDVGEVYHNVLMRFGRELSADGLPPSDGDSRWRTVTDEEIDAAVERLVSEEYPARPGQSGEVETDAAVTETESYRMRRVGRTAAFAAKALTRQIRESRVDEIYYESSFGEKGDFPPITKASPSVRVETRVEGRIDRVDVLNGGYARITDYKSGAQEFSPPDAASGYQLQLMLYMKAVSERYKPAGVFYFRVKEPRVEDYGKEDIAAEIIGSVKPDGVAVNDARSLAAMGIDPDGRSKKGVMEAGEFGELQDSVSALVGDLIEGMSGGRVDARPKTAIKLKTSANRNMKACDYCNYKGVCNYDPLFE